MNETLLTALFSDDTENVFAIIDGASCKELQEHLREHAPEHVCLYAGELAPDVAECAPYLIALLPDHPFTEWLLENCFGKHWGIFVRSPVRLRVLRKHFRTFLLVRTHEGKTVYFRYYDPRVLTTYLPTCNARELSLIFGPATAFFYEETKADGLFKFHREQGAARRERFAVTA